MPTYQSKYYPVRKLLFFAGEGLLIFASVLVVLLVFSEWETFLLFREECFIRAVVITAVFQLTLYFFDLYDLRVARSRFESFVIMTQAFGVGCIFLALFYLLFPSIIIPISLFWKIYIVICINLFLWRMLYQIILRNKWYSQKLILVGTGETAARIVHEIESNRESAFAIQAVVGSDPPVFSCKDALFKKSLKDIDGEPLSGNADRIVVALDDRRGTMPVSELLQKKMMGFSVEDGVSFYESISGKILVEKVNPAWMIFSDGFDKGRFRSFIKRLIDLIIALVILLVSLPVTIITAIFIKFESPGPVFYRQERVGERGKTFSIVKFRSMRQDAEKTGPVWAREHDNRVTRVGNFIRKVRIDEIPQIWNVFCGDMSFVGPRPERPIFVNQLTQKIPYYSLRHFAKPGITGWAQICYPYGASEEDALRKLEYDLFYIKNQSIVLDLLIIFRTIKTVLFRKGSR